MKLITLEDNPRNSHPLPHMLLCGLFLSAVLFAVCALRTEQQAAAAAQELSASVLRFHVRADDDTACAQALKLRVRDALLAYVRPLLEDVKTRSEAEEILAGHLEELEEEAARITAQYGCEEPVHASLTEELFPVRTYGSITFPAGWYHSLSVTIGSGSGHNWWCVMYPTLCFQDADSCAVTSDSEAALKCLLSPQANAVLTDETDKKDAETNSSPKIRFRIFTFLNRYLS